MGQISGSNKKKFEKTLEGRISWSGEVEEQAGSKFDL